MGEEISVIHPFFMIVENDINNGESYMRKKTGGIYAIICYII